MIVRVLKRAILETFDMKQRPRKVPKVTKGGPSGMVISLIVHSVAFFVAGLFVVFTVLPNAPPEFEPPPPVARPKMKLKKPKIKIKKSSQPKPSSRIVAKVKTAKMPEIQIPDLLGTGEGLLGGLGTGGDFMDIPTIDNTTIFGNKNTFGNDFAGRLYDLKRKSDGSPTGISNWEDILITVGKFTRGDWDLSKLEKFYKSPRTLYTKHFTFPTMPSTIAPTAFGEPDMPGYAWIAYYRGIMVHPAGGRFRFWAQADDIILVRVNGEIVVDGSVSDAWVNFRTYLSDYHNSTAGNMRYILGGRKAEIGKWIELQPGVPLDMEVIIGEIPGGTFSAMLLVEEEGADYPRNPQNGPLLPIFKTEKLTHAELDAIYELLVPGEACPTNGLVFNDFLPTISKNRDNSKGSAPPSTPREYVPENPDNPDMRTWTSNDGSFTRVGEYVSRVWDAIFIKTPEGDNVKIELSRLCSADREYLELAFPPEFRIDFLKSSKTRFIEVPRVAGALIPSFLQWQFGVRVTQVGSEVYDHELTVEYYAIGQQIIDRNKYFLMDHGASRFVPGADNDYSHEFEGKRKTEVSKYTMYNESMGRKYNEYIIVLKDKKGRIIDHRTSGKWIWNNFHKLEKLPIGAFFDDTCTRVHPTGPPRTY